jgi:hypothetical protein
MAKKTYGRPNLKLFTGEQESTDSFIEGAVHDFLRERASRNSTIDTMVIDEIFEAFIDYCRDTASDKVVLSDGRMIPLVSN